MTFVVGVDGGASKTHAIVADTAGHLCGAGASGGSNWETVGLEGAEGALRAAVNQALAAAGVKATEVGAAVLGLGGVDWPSDQERLSPLLERLEVPERNELVNDAFVALRAGTQHPWGVVVIGGSGTVAAGRNRRGDVCRTLGQSPPLFDDYGSGTDIAAAAVQAIARAYTGRGPATSLTALLCEETGCATAAELLEKLSRDSVPVPHCAPIVLREADREDEAARAIVLKAARALGESAALVIARLGMQKESVEVVLAGGLFRGNSEILLRTITGRVEREAPLARLVRLEVPPVVGAGLMALDLLDQEVGEAVHERLGGACRRHFGRQARAIDDGD